MLLRAPTLALVVLASALAGTAAAAPPTRLFLQQVGTHSAIVKWRGDAGSVCFSSKLTDLSKPNWPRCVAGVATAGNHYEAQLEGLAPQQTYYYSVAGQTGASQHFQTPPNSNKAPRDGNTHIWIVGDSGTRTEAGHVGEAEGVRDGFLAYNAANGGEPVDLFLMLGDNAYTSGSDVQYQGAVFELYTEILAQAPVWPTIGNHEMGNGDLAAFRLFNVGGLSVSADPNSYSDGDPNTVDNGMPYFDIFTLPTRGENGGVPSGTEQYYSFDAGNVHVVSLDSQLSARDTAQRAAMKDWVIADLAANERDWTIVIFHHPPYSRGTHDSDSTALLMQPFTNRLDLPMVDMRVEFTPIFDAYGVDLVYSGHSHNYERSYYLRGHTGNANTFDPAAHAELDANGQPSAGPYTQITSSGLDDRSVYTVAGNSGKGEEPNRAITPQPLMHPAMVPQLADTQGRRGLKLRGSVVVDATSTTLRARMVDSTGAVLDEFTITR
jgi:3',5'-cyclic AMP phosphodiesterase CpdA